MSSRTLAVAGLHNIRDLGGLPRHNGTTTSFGAFVRSDSPHALSADAIEQLRTYGITTVIDLRYDQERSLLPNPFAQHTAVRYHATPLFSNGAIANNLDLLRMDVFYRHLLDTAQAEIRQVYTQMAHSPGTTLFHCRVGKDRTGIISALLLMLADVKHEAIIADFVETEANIQPMLAELRAHRPAQLSPEQYEQLLDAKQYYIEAVIEHIETRYGNTHDYLHHIGVDAAHITLLYQRLTSQ